MSPPALELSHVSRRFGGVLAVDDASFEVPDGGLTALIGPNGAGKTTLFNAMTNLFPPSSGSVRFFGRDLKGLTGHKIARLGLVRTFQTARVFPGMTALENVMAGAHMHAEVGMLGQMFRTPSSLRQERLLEKKGMELLELIGLADQRNASASELPMGDQKTLEVARALMASPRMLLLDEPAAGLNDTETAELADLLAAIRACGVTIMVIEHNMSLVMGIADDVVVLDAGRVVARGAPADIQRNPRVIEAYVGLEA